MPSPSNLTAMQQQRPRIPPEIINAVLNFCISDESLLRTLSLVCKAYLEHSRHHLFSSLFLRSDQDAQDFIELLKSPLCTITAHELHLADETGDPSWYPAKLTTLDTLLTGLKVLDLQMFSILPASEQLLAMHPIFPELTEIRLNLIHSPRTKDLMTYVASFPRLTNLLVGGSFEIADVVPDPLYRLPKSIDNLILFHDCVPIVLQWFLSCRKIPIIGIIELDGSGLTSSSDDEVSTYLTHLGPALQSLILFFPYPPDDFHPTTFLSNHAGLTNLEIFGSVYSAFHTLVAALPCMRTPNLATIDISVDPSHECLPMITVAWAQLDALFDQSAFTNTPLTVTLRLDPLSFIPDEFGSWEEFQAEIMHRMPLSSKKKLLTIAHAPS